MNDCTIKYCIEYTTADNTGNTLWFYDEDDAEYEFDDLRYEHHQPAIVECRLTEYYIFGGICQGSKELKYFNIKEN